MANLLSTPTARPTRRTLTPAAAWRWTLSPALRTISAAAANCRPTAARSGRWNAENNDTAKGTVRQGEDPAAPFFCAILCHIEKMESVLDIFARVCYSKVMESELSVQKGACMKNRLEELSISLGDMGPFKMALPSKQACSILCLL